MKIISNIDNKIITIRRFKGMDKRTVKSDPLGSCYIENFRFMYDGSLQKREGYEAVADIPGIIRAVWTGNMGGAQRCYILASNTIYELSENGEKQQIATANTSSGNADFFHYKGQLYLIDGTGIYCVNKGSLSNPWGYVPLVGQLWKDGQVGDIHQPRNLLNDHARYSYIMGGNDSKILYFNEPIQSVDAIYINGVKLDSDTYVFAGDSAIAVRTLDNYDKVTVAVTYPPRSDASIDAYSCTQATVFGGANNSRPFFWGNKEFPATMYSCGYVSDGELSQSKLFYPESDGFYIPENSEFTVGDGQFPVRAVSRHYDRLLIFTEGGAWMANNADCSFESNPLININMNVSVLSDGAAIPIENQPCCIGSNAIWRWNSDTDELNDCNAYSISEPISNYIPEGFYSNGRVFADNARRELLFTGKDMPGTVLVYSIQNNAWSCFRGINADKFFNFFGKIGFCCSSESSDSSTVYRFSKDAYTDAGKEINAYFESNPLNTDSAPPWRLSDIYVSYSEGGVQLSLDTDIRSNYISTKLPDSNELCNSHYRANTGRLNSLRIRVSATGAQRQILHSVGIKVK